MDWRTFVRGAFAARDGAVDGPELRFERGGFARKIQRFFHWPVRPDYLAVRANLQLVFNVLGDVRLCRGSSGFLIQHH
jgi:hypothetical protein